MYLEINGLSKTIRKSEILKQITVSMDNGKIYGLWGKNGSGKTMLMRCICGLVFPSAGNILINGKILGKDISFPESVGVLIESPGFIEHYNAIDNLKAIASIEGNVTENEMLRLMEMLELDSTSKKKVKKYSLGMRQKLGIIAAVMGTPELIILDEPINALDESSVKKVKLLLNELKKKGSLIIISCHDRFEMEELTDEIFYMENGKIINHTVL